MNGCDNLTQRSDRLSEGARGLPGYPPLRRLFTSDPPNRIRARASRIVGGGFSERSNRLDILEFGIGVL